MKLMHGGTRSNTDDSVLCRTRPFQRADLALCGVRGLLVVEISSYITASLANSSLALSFSEG